MYNLEQKCPVPSDRSPKTAIQPGNFSVNGVQAHYLELGI
jgi:hypothetical protein